MLNHQVIARVLSKARVRVVVNSPRREAQEGKVRQAREAEKRKRMYPETK
jgi:hypothetical protein